MPVDGATAWDATTGEESDVPLAEAFNNPVTPTLQVIDPEGQLVWQSRTYYPDFSVVEEFVGVIA